MGDVKRGAENSAEMPPETEERLFRQNMAELPVEKADRPRTLFSPFLQKVALGQTRKVIDAEKAASSRPFIFGLFGSSKKDAVSGAVKTDAGMIPEKGKMENSEGRRATKSSYRHLLAEVKKDNQRIKLLEEMLRGRQEMLSAHEGRVVSLKSEFEKKLSGLGSREQKAEDRERAVAEKERAISKVKNAHANAANHISSLRSEELKLKKTKEALLEGIAAAQKKLIALKDSEKKAAGALSASEKLASEKEKNLDSIILKINYAARHLELKEKELEAAARRAKAFTAELEESTKKLRHVEEKHSHLLRQLSEQSLKEAEKLIEKSHYCLKKGEVMAAKHNYERIRELYAHLSKEKKFHIYRKVEALTRKLEAYWHLKEFSS